MAVYNHYQVMQPTTLGSGAETLRVGLGVQPLSALLVRLTAQLASANTDDNLANLLGKLDGIEVDYRGTRLVAGRAIDLYRVYRCVTRVKSRLIAPGATAGSVREVSFAIPFGRRLFDPLRCLPAVNKGDLTLTIRTVANPSGYNNYSLMVEAIELPDARPTEFYRVTTQTFAPATTGIYDIDLPRALRLAGVGIANAQSTPFASANNIVDCELLVNNAEQYVSYATFESLRAMASYLSGSPDMLALHRHTENTAAAYTQNAATLTDRAVQSPGDDFGYISFDPLGDDNYVLVTESLNNLVLRVTVGATGTIRILPVEVGTDAWLFRRSGTVGTR
ncbi:MAG: hypothetical protein K6U12_13965 [Armatimonadetes bacterium]|nr:hypothetical protein [Armatimonadota bacterium]